MSRTPQSSSYTCDVCGKELFVFCSAYQHKPFIDGKRHNEICKLCYEVPKMCEWNEYYNIWEYYNTFDPERIHTVAELMEGGWTKQECEFAIKAVKKAIAKGKKKG